MTIETELPALPEMITSDDLKPLEWIRGYAYGLDAWTAKDYEITLSTNGFYTVRRAFKQIGDESSSQYVVRDLAQADYERRILSALTLKDDPGNGASETRAAALEEAAKICDGARDNLVVGELPHGVAVALAAAIRALIPREG